MSARDDDVGRHASDPDALIRRDPAFIHRWMELFAAFVERYHHTRIDGLSNVPDGPALGVGNHNGGVISPDMWALMVGWWRHFGVDTPAYGLMHDFIFRIPGVGDTMAKLGAVPARPANAVALLSTGAKVLVYPGGDLEVFRPSSQSGRIIFGNRSGFVRVALRARVPILPVVSVGAHEAFHLFTDGRDIARALGLHRLMRVDVFPIGLSLPFGLQLGPGAYLPWPVKMHIRVLPPMQWPELSADAADDEGIVWRVREEVRLAMQAGLDELVAEGDFGRRYDPLKLFAKR